MDITSVLRSVWSAMTDTDVAALRWAVPLRVALVTSTVVGVLIAVGRPAEALTMGIGALVTGVADQRGPVAGRIKSMTFMAIGVAVAVTIVINMGRAKYAWVPFIPLCFVAVSTLTAGYMSVRDNFWPMTLSDNPALRTQGYVDSICTSIMLVCCVIILVAAVRRWLSVFSGKTATHELAEA